MTASASRACLFAALLLGLGAALGGCGGSDGPTCTPAAEGCNGRDDDCDGQVDEGFDAGAACTVGVGACQASGHKVCTSSGAATICDATAGAPSAESCNGIDDDCDGTADEGLADCCVPATARTCGAGVGVCVAGTQTCSAARAWGECLDGGGAPVTAPGQLVEICNGLDDDCDGAVDEQDAADCTLHYRDADQDGFGAPETLCLCGPAGQFTATQGGDCDDANPQVNAGAVESCNGLDDDCDAQVDEGFGVGAACTAGVGACQASGHTVCEAGGTGSVCDATAHDPTSETCNGLDDDCDGTVDNLPATACYSGPAGTQGVGACRSGTLSCSGGTGTCVGEVLPQLEICNGLDDNCNGQVDDGIAPTGSCSAGVGACQRSGQMACQGGSFTCNATPGLPSAEVCNGLDDDCNGTVDEVAPQACYTGPGGTAGVGACHGGTRTCSSGAFGPCVGEVLPLLEVCNGVDDDCDGAVDEGIAPSGTCSAGTGVCQRAGQFVCQAGTFTCNAVPGVPSAEICNGLDDDCNGTVDEVAPQACYTGPGGTAGVGACHAGTQACSFGAFGACEGEVLPAPEVCNGIDDDCDGTVDEGGAIGLCPAASNVTASTCGGASGCGASLCDATWYDLDGAFANGCECQADPADVAASNDTCATTTDLGALAPSPSIFMVGNLLPDGDTDTYRFTVTLAAGQSGPVTIAPFPLPPGIEFCVSQDACGTGATCTRGAYAPSVTGPITTTFYVQVRATASLPADCASRAYTVIANR